METFTSALCQSRLRKTFASSCISLLPAVRAYHSARSRHDRHAPAPTSTGLYEARRGQRASARGPCSLPAASGCSSSCFCAMRYPRCHALNHVIRIRHHSDIALFFQASSALMTAVSSILLFVVIGSQPESSFSLSPDLKIMPYPPAPGFPLQAPSAKISTNGFSSLSSSKFLILP